ncbi:hypothetical protein P8452_12898 [Trifolium repens]|nr:hypothetical protein P8452_12898 [Trifolium repens]
MTEVHGMVKRNGEILEEQNKELDLLLQQLIAVEDVGNMHDASDYKVSTKRGALTYQNQRYLYRRNYNSKNGGKTSLAFGKDKESSC